MCSTHLQRELHAIPGVIRYGLDTLEVALVEDALHIIPDFIDGVREVGLHGQRVRHQLSQVGVLVQALERNLQGEAGGWLDSAMLAASSWLECLITLHVVPRPLLQSAQWEQEDAPGQPHRCADAQRRPRARCSCVPRPRHDLQGHLPCSFTEAADTLWGLQWLPAGPPATCRPSPAASSCKDAAGSWARVLQGA